MRLLALIAVSNNTPATYGLIVQGMDTQVLSPDLVGSTIESMVHAGSLTGQQALHFLAPYGNFAPAAAGNISLGDLIAENRISMADFAALNSRATFAGRQHDPEHQLLAERRADRRYRIQECNSRTRGHDEQDPGCARRTGSDCRCRPQLCLGSRRNTADERGSRFVVDAAKFAGSRAGPDGVRDGSGRRHGVRRHWYRHAPCGRYHDLVGPSLTLGDAFAQILSAGAGGSQALSDGAIAIIGAMYNTALGANPSVATNPDVIFNAIGHGLTADQAVAI